MSVASESTSVDISVNMPRLTVIVPVYNVECYIDSCLTSIVKQSFNDLEVICVNDGSTDGSLSKLKAWAAKDKRIRVIDQPNAGPSAARNAGIAAAQGTYICFVDGDDRIYPQACEHIVGMLEESGADILTFGAIYVPEKAGSPWYYWALSPRDITYDHFDIGIMSKEPSRPFVWKMAFKRQFLIDNHIRFDESVRFGEDQIFCFAVYPRAHKVRFSSRKLYEYRLERTGSAMDRAKPDLHERMLKHITIVDRVFADWEDLDILHLYAGDMLMWAIDLVLLNMIKAPQDQFLDICNHLSAVISKYLKLEDINAIASKADRALALELYRRPESSLIRRKWGAFGWYRQHYGRGTALRWLLTGWYLPDVTDS